MFSHHSSLFSRSLSHSLSLSPKLTLVLLVCCCSFSSFGTCDVCLWEAFLFLKERSVVHRQEGLCLKDCLVLKFEVLL
ncbi:hypothetical protein RIF29_29217 [Crotalaria pallida]|uniref:Uncharacterized protein n=1 Tax=Crotalaria pallida TaxID=3830 RepID=A0AAN9EGH4_CROPI